MKRYSYTDPVSGFEYVCEYHPALRAEYCPECGMGAHAHHHYVFNPAAPCESCYGGKTSPPCEECGGTGYVPQRIAGFGYPHDNPVSAIYVNVHS